MAIIFKAAEKDSALLSEIGKLSFTESQGKSASAEVIKKYIDENYTHGVFKEDLKCDENVYHIIYHDNKPCGYSKIILNSSHPDIPYTMVTKMERLYLLKEFYDLKLGYELFKFNIELSKKNDQEGMWLFVWKENTRAVNFYKKNGFEITGSYDFKLTEAHSNPNHQMFLKF